MGLIYTVAFSQASVAAVRDLYTIKASTITAIRIHGFTLSQETLISDANEKELRLTVKRGSSTITVGSGGSTATPSPQLRSAPALGGSATVVTNNTTQTTVNTGSLVTLEQFSWNVRAPFIWWYPPELRPVVEANSSNAVYWILALDTAPSSTTINGTLWFETDQ